MLVGQGFSKLTVWFSQGQVKARTQLRKNKYRTVRALFSAKFQRLRQGFLIEKLRSRQDTVNSREILEKLEHFLCNKLKRSS
ncbi:hypothetical protein M0802_014609 [Mischocyttarus mexicanus]|nr:hypothetical protein M0802_014609 [Mischocyttarus mexicanus]